MHHVNRIVALGLAALLVPVAAARPVKPVRPVKPADPAALSDYLRAAEEPGRRLALEVAVRSFRPADGGGRPVVTLVGVAHVGEAELYREIQELLDEQDLVLYESVKPSGTGGAGGETDAERRASTEAAMRFTASMAHRYRDRAGRWPRSIEELGADAADLDARIAEWIAGAQTDGWGRPVTYTVEGGGFTLLSAGADGRPGGEGAAADLRVTDASDVASAAVGREGDSLQSQLALTLGLEFQLEAVDYDRPHFRCSDMSMDQVDRALADEGVDFRLDSTIAGSGALGRFAVLVLRLVRMADVFFEGLISDYGKIMLIEMFSNEAFMEASLRQMGPGLERVLIDRRNEVVIADLQAVLDSDRDVSSVAIFYGAAHMPDLQDRLAAMGYVPGEERWITAFEVDLEESALTPAQVRSVRRMLRQQMRFTMPR